jgi:hypothetical protein
LCVLCGYGLSPYDWASASDALGPENRDAHRTARRAAIVRARICDGVLQSYGVRVHTSTGREYIVSDSKGRTRIANSLPELWAQAAALAGRPLDPLDPDVLARLSR